MTQEDYDAWYALNCSDCPFNDKEMDKETKEVLNHCQKTNWVHSINSKKPRWCPYKVEGRSDGINVKKLLVEIAEGQNPGGN